MNGCPYVFRDYQLLHSLSCIKLKQFNLQGMFNSNPFTALLWQCRWCSYASNSVNTLEDICTEQYNWLGEQLMWTTLQHSLKMGYQVVNPSKQFLGAEGYQPAEIHRQVKLKGFKSCAPRSRISIWVNS
jgi:hypothetical protein